MLRRLNPFRALPNPREVWAWGMYDLANQSFTLLITTFFFAIYFRDVVVGDPRRGDLLWAASFAIASLIVVLVSPLLGALADFTGLKKRFLLALMVACVVMTGCLSLAGPGDVALAMAVYIGAAIAFMAGENFLGAFLPEIATRETMGRVSAIGWTMGYIGALVCLPMAMLVPGAQGGPAGFRGVFLFAAAWFLLNTLPTLLFLRERKAAERLAPGRSLWTIGFVRIGETLRDLRRFRQLAVFLAVFFTYACGVQAIILFSGIIANDYLNPPQQNAAQASATPVMVFIWALSLVAGATSFLTVFLQDRIGHRPTIVISLLVWAATLGGAIALPAPAPNTPAPFLLWIVGVGVGVGLGTIGTASRALVGAMTPTHKAAEFFGFWGMTYKAAGVLGPALFGGLSGGIGRRAALGAIGALFVLGLLGVALINVRKGSLAAEEAEREARPDPRDIAAAQQTASPPPSGA